MTFIEALQNGLDRVLPRKTKSNAVPAVGIGNGRGMVNYEDDVSLVHPHFFRTLLLSAPLLYTHSQICCGASKTYLQHPFT
jgi:hypothetical protein